MVINVCRQTMVNLRVWTGPVFMCGCFFSTNLENQIDETMSRWNKSHTVSLHVVSASIQTRLAFTASLWYLLLFFNQRPCLIYTGSCLNAATHVLTVWFNNYAAVCEPQDPDTHLSTRIESVLCRIVCVFNNTFRKQKDKQPDFKACLYFSYYIFMQKLITKSWDTGNIFCDSCYLHWSVTCWPLSYCNVSQNHSNDGCQR